MRRVCQFLITLFLVLFLYGAGARIVGAQERERSEDSPGIEQEALLEEFDFREIEESLRSVTSDDRIRFGDLVSAMLAGDTGEAGTMLLGFLRDQVFCELGGCRKRLAGILMTALAAAVFSGFSGSLRSRQVSEAGFYISYILLVTLCLTAFRTAMSGLEERMAGLAEFMKVLCPSYFLAVAFASGTSTSLFFYNIVLLLIWIMELVILQFLLPVVNLYVMIRVMGNLAGEDFLSEFADLLEKLVSWILRSLLAAVAGINLVQGLLGPALDTIKRSALTRTAEALPLVGNVLGSTTEMVLAAAVLIKNGVGAAGAAAAAVLCAVPLLEMLAMAFLYQLAAALVQPVSDRRIIGCIRGVSEGYELLVRVVFTAGTLFLLTIAVVAFSTS